MKAYNDTQCKLCEKDIKAGDSLMIIPIHGKYHEVCSVCWNQIYNKVADIIIKKIKE